MRRSGFATTHHAVCYILIPCRIGDCSSRHSGHGLQLPVMPLSEEMPVRRLNSPIVAGGIHRASSPEHGREYLPEMLCLGQLLSHLAV